MTWTMEAFSKGVTLANVAHSGTIGTGRYRISGLPFTPARTAVGVVGSLLIEQRFYVLIN